jgi:hypothetical protein
MISAVTEGAPKQGIRSCPKRHQCSRQSQFFEIEAAQKLAQTTGLLCSIRVVTAGSGAPNLIFTDNDDNEFYQIDATNLVAGQVIPVFKRFSNGLILSSLPEDSMFEMKMGAASRMSW